MTEPDLSAILSKLEPGMRLEIPAQWADEQLGRHDDVELCLPTLAGQYGCSIQRLANQGYAFFR